VPQDHLYGWSIKHVFFSPFNRSSDDLLGISCMQCLADIPQCSLVSNVPGQGREQVNC
jgi:hypothetical protein